MSKEEFLAQKRKREQQEAAAEAAAKAAKKAPPPAANKIQNNNPGNSSSSAPQKTQPTESEAKRKTPAAEQPASPEDFASWTIADFEAAANKNDRRLPDIVEQLVKQSSEAKSDTRNNIELLVSLWDMFSGSLGRRNSQYGNLREVILKALLTSDSAIARRKIEQLVTDELTDTSGKAASVTKFLLENPSPANEDLLFQVITNTDWETQELNTHSNKKNVRRRSSDAISLVMELASPSLRLRLANHVVTQTSSAGLYSRVVDIVREPRAENLAAQKLLYSINRPEASLCRDFEYHFMDQCMKAVAFMLGVPSEDATKVARHSTEEKKLVDPVEVVAQLWTADFVATVQRRLLSIDSLEDGKYLVRLAAALPSPSLRTTLFNTLEKHWEEGTEAIEIDSGFTEPGFLILLKQLPRKNTIANKQPFRGPTSNKAAALLEARQDQDRIAREWLKASEMLVRTMCRQLRTAAVDNARLEDLPIKIPDRAEITASYAVDWPSAASDVKQLPADLSSWSLRVRYLRIDQRAKPAKVLAYFRRQAPKSSEHGLEDGIWLDSLQATNAERTSTDVLITCPGKILPNTADQEQRVIVEILFVRCNFGTDNGK